MALLLSRNSKACYSKSQNTLQIMRYFTGFAHRLWNVFAVVRHGQYFSAVQINSEDYITKKLQEKLSTSVTF